MAGDWIKMRIDLQSHPKIVRILSATSSDKFRVIGGLHAVWSVFDLHSENGVLTGYTPETMDHIIGWDGFSEAMIKVGWLLFDGAETLSIPEFSEHNGKSAKRRGEDQKRKRNVRKDSDVSPDECGQNADKKRTREEKRREEVNPPKSPAQPEGFAEFWNAYPRKIGKGNAEKAWRNLKPDLAVILPAIERARATEQWRKDDGQFIPHPATWLNQRRWEDDPEPVKQQPKPFDMAAFIREKTCGY